MRIRVDPKRDAPLYRQVMAEIQRVIATRRLRVGDRVPSVRDLAVDLRINPNTVARAYRELDRLGVLETRGPDGSFVRAGQVSYGRELREREYRQKLEEAVATAVSMTIQPSRAKDIFYDVAAAAYAENRGDGDTRGKD